MHECEETLQKLWEEVEIVDVNLERLGSVMEPLKHAMERPWHPRNIVAGFGYSQSNATMTVRT